MDCKPDPMGPCHCCTGKKLGFSLMLPNEATGKTGRGKLDPEVVTSKHIAFSSMRCARASSQCVGLVWPVRYQALPLAMLSVLELDSGSSHSPIEAPPSDAPAHCTHMQGTKTPLVPFYIQAPAPSKMSCQSATTAAAAAAAAAPALASTARSCAHAPAHPPAGATSHLPACCHGLDCADPSLQLIIGTALVLILSHPPPLCVTLISDDSRTCDQPGSMAFHDVPILGQVY
jgi:hypothetical protein